MFGGPVGLLQNKVLILWNLDVIGDLRVHTRADRACPRPAVEPCLENEVLSLWSLDMFSDLSELLLDAEFCLRTLFLICDVRVFLLGEIGGHFDAQLHENKHWPSHELVGNRLNWTRALAYNNHRTSETETQRV